MTAETSKREEPNSLLREWFDYPEELLGLTSELAGCEIRAPDTGTALLTRGRLKTEPNSAIILL